MTSGKEESNFRHVGVEIRGSISPLWDFQNDVHPSILGPGTRVYRGDDYRNRVDRTRLCHTVYPPWSYPRPFPQHLPESLCPLTRGPYQVGRRLFSFYLKSDDTRIHPNIGRYESFLPFLFLVPKRSHVLRVGSCFRGTPSTVENQ